MYIKSRASFNAKWINIIQDFDCTNSLAKLFEILKIPSSVEIILFGFGRHFVIEKKWASETVHIKKLNVDNILD